jgi:Tol biopolymer transport system component
MKPLYFGKIIFFAVTLLFFTTTPAVSGYVDKKVMTIEDNIDNISFSSNGKKILFDRQKGTGPQLINVYDLETHQLTYYQPPQNETWRMARYSDDGKYIVFSIGSPHREIWKPDENRLKKNQIVIMEPNGKNLRVITSSRWDKRYPIFSHSGKTIIYAKTTIVKENGRIISSLSGYDFYEVDIKTGDETRLTWLHIFALLSPPFEFPDGRTIVFSEYGTQGKPRDLMSKDNSFMVKKGDKKLPYPFVIPDNRNPLISDRNNTKRPLISRDGNKILFQAHAQKPDGVHGEGDQFYEYSKDGKHTQLTYLPVSTIYSADISPDGHNLAVIYAPLSRSPVRKKIAICNINDGTYKAIELPDQPSRIINQHCE